MATKRNAVCEYKGRFHRTCGRFINSASNVAPKKFLLSTDQAAAERIAERLSRLWDEVVSIHKRESEAEAAYLKRTGSRLDGVFNRITGDAKLGHPPTNEPLWNDESLIVAEAVRSEERSVEVKPFAREAPTSYLQRIADLRADYSLIEFIPEEAIYVRAKTKAAVEVKQLDAEAAELAHLAGAPEPSGRAGTLYEVLDAYADWARRRYVRDGLVTENGKKVARAAERIKASQVDIPLERLNHDVIETMADYWYQRPLARRSDGTESDKPISVDTVGNMVKHLRRVLTWLKRSDRFAWQDPNDIIGSATKGRRIAEIRTEAEKKAHARGPETWTLSELTLLYRYATDRERLYILMGLNAGFAQSECKHLDRSEISLNSDPPILDFIRNKTGRRGGVMLWPETVTALQWVAKQQTVSPTKKSTRAILTEKGSELGTGQIANAWNKLLDRVQKVDPEFPRLPFKHLRKTSAQLVQDVGGGDSEVIAIMHARAKWTARDDQADRYYRRSLERVYAANERVHKYLKPMFDVAPNAFTKSRKRGGSNASPDLRERIIAAHADCGNVSQVAHDLGISRQTVYRHLPDSSELKADRKTLNGSVKKKAPPKTKAKSPEPPKTPSHPELAHLRK